MGLDRAVGRQKQGASTGSVEANLFALARDYERWGLAPEAEVTRHRARQATINRLLVEAKAGQCERGSTSPLA